MDSSTLRSPLQALNPSNPICVQRSAPVSEAIEKMKSHNIGFVCVVSEDNLIGVFTERDVLTKVIASDVDVRRTRVEQVMTRDPEYLFIDDHLAFALNRMHVGGFRHVPLINLQGQPIGVISVRDILGYLVQSISN